MSDDVTLNPGTGGAVIAADEIGNKFFQRVKLIHGADGVNAGDVSTSNRFPVNSQINGPLTAFGDLRVAILEADVRIDAIYGINDDIHETFVDASPGTGSATASSSEFACQTGTGIGGYGVVRSRSHARYHPGEGLLCRFSARFDSANAVANSLQFAGMFALEPAIAFGYDGTQFGVLRRHGSAAEIRTLTISAAPTGSETVTVTLNGTGYNVAVTSGTVQQAAWEVSRGTFTGWAAFALDDTVIFQATGVGARSGSYLVSSTGTLAGSFVQDQAGADHTYSWVYQAAWNLDPMDGTGPSGMTLDPSKGNVYQIQMQWLGYGAITFSVESDTTGEFVPVHRINYANSNTEPSVNNPSFHVGWIAASLGSTTNITVRGASATIATEGKHEIPTTTHAEINTSTGVGTSWESILAINNLGIYNGVINQTRVNLKLGTAAVDGTKPAQVALFINPTFTGRPTWSLVHSGRSPVTVSKTTGLTITGGDIIAAAGVAKSGSFIFDFSSLSATLNPGDILVLAAQASTGSTDVTASLTWQED